MGLGSRELSIETAISSGSISSGSEFITSFFKSVIKITQSLLVKVVRQNLQKIMWKSCLLLLEREQLQPACRESHKYLFIYLFIIFYRKV